MRRPLSTPCTHNAREFALSVSLAHSYLIETIDVLQLTILHQLAIEILQVASPRHLMKHTHALPGDVLRTMFSLLDTSAVRWTAHPAAPCSTQLKNQSDWRCLYTELVGIGIGPGCDMSSGEGMLAPVLSQPLPRRRMWVAASSGLPQQHYPLL